MSDKCQYPGCDKPAEFEDDFVIGGDDLQPDMEEITVSLCQEHSDKLNRECKVVSDERL